MDDDRDTNFSNVLSTTFFTIFNIFFHALLIPFNDTYFRRTGIEIKMILCFFSWVLLVGAGGWLMHLGYRIYLVHEGRELEFERTVRNNETPHAQDQGTAAGNIPQTTTMDLPSNLNNAGESKVSQAPRTSLPRFPRRLVSLNDLKLDAPIRDLKLTNLRKYDAAKCPIPKLPRQKSVVTRQTRLAHLENIMKTLEEKKLLIPPPDIPSGTNNGLDENIKPDQERKEEISNNQELINQASKRKMENEEREKSESSSEEVEIVSPQPPKVKFTKKIRAMFDCAKGKPRKFFKRTKHVKSRGSPPLISSRGTSYIRLDSLDLIQANDKIALDQVSDIDNDGTKASALIPASKVGSNERPLPVGNFAASGGEEGPSKFEDDGKEGPPVSHFQRHYAIRRKNKPPPLDIRSVSANTFEGLPPLALKKRK